MIAPAEALGVTPVFYPITVTGEPDLQWLRNLEASGPTAVLVAHFFGLPISLVGVRELCDERGMTLIEDCAHAFFGNRAGTPVGATGDFAIASLPKFFPVLEGGLLTSRLGDLRAVCLQGAGLAAELKAAWNLFEAAADSQRPYLLRLAAGIGNRTIGLMRRGAAAHHAPAGTGSARSSAAPSPASVRSEALADDLLRPMRLRRLERWLVGHSHRQRIVENRRRNYRLLAELLTPTRARILFPELDAGAVPYVFPVHVPDPDRTYGELRTARVPAFRWDRYWPGAITSAADVGRQWGHHVIQLSCHQDLSEDNMRRIAATVSHALDSTGCVA